MSKITIEKAAYDRFRERFREGAFAQQRLGQAFYNEFDLHKIADQTALLNIYAKDGDHAVRCIESFVEFS